jgi:hypothetical protein
MAPFVSSWRPVGPGPPVSSTLPVTLPEPTRPERVQRELAGCVDAAKSLQETRWVLLVPIGRPAQGVLKNRVSAVPTPSQATKQHNKLSEVSAARGEPTCLVACLNRAEVRQNRRELHPMRNPAPGRQACGWMREQTEVVVVALTESRSSPSAHAPCSRPCPSAWAQWFRWCQPAWRAPARSRSATTR